MSKIHYKDTSKIDWTAIEITRIKRENDMEIYKTIEHFIKTDKNKHLSMLSFPANGWIFERNLSDILESTNGSLNSLGLEHDPGVYKLSIKKMKTLKKDFPGNKYDLVPVSALDYLKGTDKTFDIIYLDWMGTWTISKREEITTIFDRRLLNKNALLIFTLMLYRGNGPAIDELDRLKDNDYISFPFDEYIEGEPSDNYALKTKGLGNKIASLGLDYGCKVNLSKFGLYPGIGGQPEISFIFKITSPV